MNEFATHRKEFDSWNEIKKHLEVKCLPDFLYFYEREVWWCAIGINVSVEIDGKNGDFERPVLIIKKFNKFMFWGIPLSSKKEVQSIPISGST